MRTTQRRLIGVLAAGACALATLGTTVTSADAAGPKHPKPHHRSSLEPIQLLSFNDFHGNLAPPSGSSGRNVIGHEIDA
jgi:5'-nucleotidase